MSIHISWYDQEKTIVYWVVGGSWTLEEFYEAHEKTLSMIAGADYPVATIVNALDVTNRPAGSLLPHFKRVLETTPLESLVYVRSLRGSWMIEIFINIVTKLNTRLQVKRIRFAHSVDEAVAIVREAVPVP